MELVINVGGKMDSIFLNYGIDVNIINKNILKEVLGFKIRVEKIKVLGENVYKVYSDI